MIGENESLENCKSLKEDFVEADIMFHDYCAEGHSRQRLTHFCVQQMDVRNCGLMEQSMNNIRRNGSHTSNLYPLQASLRNYPKLPAV
ncbi:hypothetical protein DPMN_012064 [Dreissena polymorpha]|uniref:Uncharacterized protein n=1 Tax=Dreissena polymorpha TaxID=45954 RepID=A0A9D4N7B1_DREPO|nr:hypothetical protein DPMN_012064 [Dreissena polymorpha]